MAKTKAEKVGKRIDRDPEVRAIEDRIEGCVRHDPSLLDLILFEYRTLLVEKAVGSAPLR